MPQKDKNKVLDESMQRILAKIQGENPDVKPVTLSPSNRNIFSRLMMPKGAEATTNPFTGNITYNPDMMQGMNQNDMENTVTHEMAHSRQSQHTPWYKILPELFTPDEKVPEGYKGEMNTPYHWRPRELEAFGAEKTRTLTHHLPYMRDPQTGMGDIDLPKQRSVKVGPTSNKLKQLTGMR